MTQQQSQGEHINSTRRSNRRGGYRQVQDLFCSTNGCATFLRPDPRTNVATCPICGMSRFMRKVR